MKTKHPIIVLLVSGGVADVDCDHPCAKIVYIDRDNIAAGDEPPFISNGRVAEYVRSLTHLKEGEDYKVSPVCDLFTKGAA